MGAAVVQCFPLSHVLPGAYKCETVGAWGLTPGHWGAAAAPALCLSPASWPLCPAAKPGYCYHIPGVEDLLHKDCGSCHMDFCYLPSVCGNCKALFRRFFFNASSQRCEEFIYGGCGGNMNNFETMGECFQPNPAFKPPT
uniref:BPTI/Kunitz inhibitor domain-containing protein n=1 Tax=Cyanoderma ruficeps TaxID=181631 RepID=A0A8C3R8N9_9PASS